VRRKCLKKLRYSNTPGSPDIISPMTKPTEEKSLDWHEEECRATFDRKHKIMSMFSDNAKTYIQLSGAALALTLTFAHEILRIPKDQKVADIWMILMWSCFLLAIIAGAFYQYRAVKLLETEINWQSYDWWRKLEPGVVYGVMLAAFYGGTIIFTGYAIFRLWRG
jgi:hypothetical protein